jgi:lipopolysaccharide biosynthesis glycosyltransferase
MPAYKPINQEISASGLENEPISLVCTADDNYSIPLATLLCSVLKNLGSERKLSVFVIDGGIRKANKIKIAKSVNSNKVELTWLKPPENSLRGVQTLHYYTKANHHRFFIPELLPQCRKTIYLDSDLIVVKDLGELWDMDIEDYYALAAQDMYPDPLSHGYRNLLDLTELENNKFFNAGVMVINLDKWRAENIGHKVIEYISQYNLPGNQVALNMLLKGRWKEIDPRWNRTAGIYEFTSWTESRFSEEEFTNLITNPYIIHFTSADKPWNSIDRCSEQTLFYQYLDMTVWSGWRFTPWKRIKRRFIREINKIKPGILSSK